MKCNKYKIQLSDYIDGRLQNAEKSKLESHINKCDSCRRDLELLQDYRKFSSAVEHAESPETIKENVWRSISEESDIISTSKARMKLYPKLTWMTAAAAIIIFMLIIPSLFQPQEITVSFDYLTIKKGKGPSEKRQEKSEGDPRVSAMLGLTGKLDCTVKDIYLNPEEMADRMVIKVPMSTYDQFREEFNSLDISDKLPEISFKRRFGSVNIQVYFSGRKFIAGDFNNDGRVDLGAYFNRGRNRGEFYLAMNDGNNGLLEPVKTQMDDTLGYLYRSDELLSGDFNNDGFDDLTVRFSKGLNRDSWIIYLNNGSGGFKEGIRCNSGEKKLISSELNHPFTGDFNGDGYSDIGTYFFRGEQKGKFIISINNKNMSFAAPMEFITGHTGLQAERKYTPLIMDINNDNYSDIIIYWQEGERNAFWYVSENNRSGAGAKEYPAGFNNGTMAFMGEYLPFAGDINGDGFDELLVKIGTSDEVANWYIMLNDGDGSFTSSDHFIDFAGEIDFIVR